MPIHKNYAIKNGIRYGYYEFGKSGKIYKFIPNNQLSRVKAYNKCLRQAKAIKRSEFHR